MDKKSGRMIYKFLGITYDGLIKRLNSNKADGTHERLLDLALNIMYYQYNYLAISVSAHWYLKNNVGSEIH